MVIVGVSGSLFTTLGFTLLSDCSSGSLLKRFCAALKLDGIELTGSKGLFPVSVFISVFSSSCCCNLKKLLLGLSCTRGILGGGGDVIEDTESSLTQLGLGLVTTGLGSVPGAPSDGLFRGTLGSDICGKDGFEGSLIKGLLVSS